MNRFKRLLEQGPVLFDGAMGTMLYNMGIYINRSFDETNISNPQLVIKVHRGYVDAGAMVIQTNTFGANRVRLAKFGLDGRLKEINKAGVQLAKQSARDDVLVAGSMGPTGLIPDIYHPQKLQELKDIFKEQAEILLQEGVDVIILETFRFPLEIQMAITAVKEIEPQFPVIALMSFDEELRVADGSQPEKVAQLLIEWGADVIGSNCGIGPAQVYDVVSRMVGDGRIVMAQPNAGLPRQVESRLMYMATPDYFAEYAKRFLDLGVRIVGGCCGTTPEHIHRMAQALKMRKKQDKRRTLISIYGNSRAVVESFEEIPVEKRSILGGKLKKKEFIVSVEVDPPRGLDVTKTINNIKRLCDKANVEFINIADGPRASARMSAFALALLVKDLGIEPVVHVTTRDRNLLGIQADLFGMHVLGIRNLLVITGDPSKLGDYPEATTVYDLNSVGLLEMISSLNKGVEPSGRNIGQQTGFVKGCGVEPGAVDFNKEMEKLDEKIEAGADFVMTQPVFDFKTVDRFLEYMKNYPDIPIILGIWPLASYRNAEFLNNEVPGIHIPDEIMQRMKDAGRGEEAMRTGIEIAAEMVEAFKHRIQGIYIMPPFGKVGFAIGLLERLGMISKEKE